MPVLAVDVFEGDSCGCANELMENLRLMLEALDDLKANEIYVTRDRLPRNALWGEMMSTRALRLGATGAVLNGYSRDTKAVLKLNFPTFSSGPYAQDPRRVIKW